MSRVNCTMRTSNDNTIWWLVTGAAGAMSLGITFRPPDHLLNGHVGAIAYHSLLPMHSEIGTAVPCDWLNGKTCHGDVTYLGATELVARAFRKDYENPSLAIFADLIERYHDMEKRQIRA